MYGHVASFSTGHAIQIYEENNRGEANSISSHTTKSTSGDSGEEAAAAHVDPLGLQAPGIGSCSIKHRYSYDPMTGTVTTPSRQFKVHEHPRQPLSSELLESPGPKTVVRNRCNVALHVDMYGL
jgi:hypothetical protein